MPEQFHLFVELHAHPGTGNDLAPELDELARKSLETPFCTAFSVSRSTTDPDTFYLFESFTSADVYPDHVNTDHAQFFLTSTVPRLVASRSAKRLRDLPPVS
jgi:quinol monooxygenase YgiN